MFSIKEGNDYFVYMHVFPNDKVYIGITSQNPPEKRWLDSGVGYKPQPRMWRAIQKYGWENVEHIIIARYVNIETAKNMEIDLIAMYDSTNRKHGYNASPGGWIMGEESKKKLSESCKGRVVTKETREKMSKSLKGRKPSPKSIEHIKEYNRTRDYSKMVQPNETPVLQYDVETTSFVKEYKSINNAAIITGLDVRNIAECTIGRTNQVCGYMFVLKKDYDLEHIIKRLYSAQNPVRCPCMVKYIHSGTTRYYKTIHDMCDDNSFVYKSVTNHLRCSTRPYKNQYAISRISIPDYIEATGKPFFDRKEPLEQRK